MKDVMSPVDPKIKYNLSSVEISSYPLSNQQYFKKDNDFNFNETSLTFIINMNGITTLKYYIIKATVGENFIILATITLNFES